LKEVALLYSGSAESQAAWGPPSFDHRSRRRNL